MGFDQILVELQDVMGDDRRIAESAWTSSYTNCKKELRTNADVERVVRLLGDSKPPHGVPFESVVFYFWYRLPITSDRQYVTHRIQSINGMSGRYRTMPEDWYRVPEDVVEICELMNAGYLVSLYEEACQENHQWYQAIVKVAKEREKSKQITNEQCKRFREIMRGVLPQSSMTERTATINLRSFANFQKQRNDSHAAPEMRDLAQKMLAEVEKCGKIPVALEVLKANGWVI